MTGGELRWVALNDVIDDLHAQGGLWAAIEAFEPLPYPAGRAAAGWLQTAARQRKTPIHTMLAVNARSGAVCGFFATRPVEFNLSKTRLVLLQLMGAELKEDPQRGELIEQIARSAATTGGFGRQLVAVAAGDAIERRALGLIVEPDDQRTRELWCRNHHFREFDPRPEEGTEHPEWLWFPLGDPPRGRGWPS